MDLLLACIAMTIDNISSNTYREVKVVKGSTFILGEGERQRRRKRGPGATAATSFSANCWRHLFPAAVLTNGSVGQASKHISIDFQCKEVGLPPESNQRCISWKISFGLGSFHLQHLDRVDTKFAQRQKHNFYRRRQIEKCQNLRSLNCSFDLATSSTIVPCQDFLGFWCRPPRWWRRPP